MFLPYHLPPSPTVSNSTLGEHSSGGRSGSRRGGGPSRFRRTAGPAVRL